MRRYGPSVNRLARSRYDISGKQLLARLILGESGDRAGAVSTAGARGRAQFTPGSREIAVDRFGVDPWRSADEAVHAAALHLLGKINGSKGLEGYNPGDPNYPRYILGQHPGKIGGGGSGPAATRAPSSGGAEASAPVLQTPDVGSIDLQGLIAALQPRAQMPSSGGLPDPAFSARRNVALPAGYQAIQSGGVSPAEKPDIGAILAAASTAGPRLPQAQATTPGTAQAPALRVAGEGRRGKVIVAPGANRQGAALQPVLTSFLHRVAGLAGEPVRVGTGTNHDRLTVDGNVSDHWDGHGADLPVPVDSAEGDRIATAGLIAAGVPAKRAAAMARRGGLYTLQRGKVRIQVIWKTNQGGNHHNHVHFGVRFVG